MYPSSWSPEEAEMVGGGPCREARGPEEEGFPRVGQGEPRGESGSIYGDGASEGWGGLAPSLSWGPNR